MSADYIRLAKPPAWCVQYPTCSACCVDLTTDGDGWICPVCGTFWGQGANDGDEGSLFPDWSGEEATGPIVSEEEAHLWGSYQERLERHMLLPKIFPDKPRPPVVSITTGSIL